MLQLVHFSIIDYEFSRRCMHSEVILSRLTDDLILRYSPKEHPHPDFFKEDAAMALNQLTLFSDCCIFLTQSFSKFLTSLTFFSRLV